MTGPMGVGFPRPTPVGPTAPEPDDPIIAALRALLPDRSAEDRAHGVIRASFGMGESASEHIIPVLSARDNRVWQERFRSEWETMLSEIEADATGAVVIRLLTGETDRQIAMLEAYSPSHLARAFLESNATEEQILDAFLGVTAAAYPLPVKLARVVLGNRDVARWVRLQLVRMLYSLSTSSSPPSTDGTPEPPTT